MLLACQCEGDASSHAIVCDSRTKPQGSICKSGRGDTVLKIDKGQSWEATRRMQVHRSYQKLFQEGENN